MRAWVRAVPGVLSPVAVTIIAKHKGDVIQVAFSKDRWDEVVKTAATSADKNEVTTKLRTQDDLQMAVTATGDPKPYYLIVWLADEVQPDLAPVTVPMSKYTREHPDAGKAPAGSAAGGTSPVMIVIAVALVAIVLLLAFMAFRRKGRS